MYRETASYITTNYSNKDTVIAISPSGPTPLALSYYLSDNFNLSIVEPKNMDNMYGKKGYIFVEQRLGIENEPWAKSKNFERYEKCTRFVGIDLINKN